MCCVESVVQIGIGNGPSVAVRALVVDEALFGYDLLLRLNAIRQLGGMTMSATGEVKFPQRERLMCAAITLDEPFTLNTTRPSAYGPHLGNGPVTSHLCL